VSGSSARSREQVACPECGKRVTRNNLNRHRATHGVEAPSSNGSGRKAGTRLSAASRKRFASAHAQSKAVGSYLESLAEQSETRRNGGRRARGANLGRLKGFPNWSDDPDTIDAAADAIAANGDEVASYVAALRLQQRALDLHAVADELRGGSGPGAIEAAFIEVAGAWAAEHGISYAAFRAMGVPAAVLREAGVK
jgi:hypothetical protein